MASKVDPRTRIRDVDNKIENSVSFFFLHRNLETLTGILELQEIEPSRYGEHNCRVSPCTLGAQAFSGRFCVAQSRAVLATILLHDTECDDGL